jgi:single-strand DNA-binding protein
MARASNVQLLTGWVVGTVKTDTTSGGTFVLTFGVNTPYFSNGERHPNFHNITFYGDRAKSVSKFLEKGMKVTVVGETRNRRYEDDNGNVRYYTNVVIDDVDVHGNGNGNGNGSHDSESEAEEEEPKPKRKRRTTRKKAATPPKEDDAVEDEDADDDEEDGMPF